MELPIPAKYIKQAIKQMNLIEELEKSKYILERELDRVNEQIYQAKLEQHRLSIGCIVIVNYAEFKVTRADFTHEKPWVWGVSKYKNGEFGTNECCLYYDWKLK